MMLFGDYKGFRDSSSRVRVLAALVENLGCFQHPHGDPQGSVAPVSGDLMPSLGPAGTGTHKCKQNMLTHIEITKSFFFMAG